MHACTHVLLCVSLRPLPSCALTSSGPLMRALAVAAFSDDFRLASSLCPMRSFWTGAVGDSPDGRRYPSPAEVHPGEGVPQVFQQRRGTQVSEAPAVRRAVPGYLREGLRGECVRLLYLRVNVRSDLLLASSTF